MHASFKVLALLTLASVTASAQGLGDQLRVHAPAGVTEGRVLRMDSSSLVLDDGSRHVAVAWTKVDSMFRRVSKAREGAVGMGLFGATVGAFGRMFRMRSVCDRGSVCRGGNAMSAVGRRALWGGLFGAGIGAAIGSSNDKWVPVGRWSAVIPE